MPTKAQPKRKKKNPVATGSAEKPFPFMDPDYPVKPWLDRASGRRFQTVTVPLEDGRFLATIAEDQEFRFVGDSRQDAEKGVLDAYLRPKRIAQNRRVYADQAEEDYYNKTKNEKRHSLEDVAAGLGYDLDSRRRR